MNCANPNLTIRINATSAVCPIGEATGKKNIAESKIPVLSCEGACIRGEIARLAANIVSKGSRKNNFAELALGFGSDLADPREQNHSNSVLFLGFCE